ncbi:MAG: IS5 family transposase, partial [Elusimicrobia bacterium]|nr:IS5 family transposase [Elusimicrobiota bacterium]
MSYKSKDRLRDGGLFKELMPFGGKLNEKNQWIVLHDQIPWGRLEEIYRKYHSHMGRPGKDSQLMNGLLIIQHLKGISDEKLVEEFLENPYLQYFCGYDQLVTNEKEIESSTLSKARGRLGVEYFRRFEEEIVGVLIQEKLIKSKEQMVDATVYPAGIKYPTDTGLLEDVRQWLVKSIKELKRIGRIKENIRTYCRKARAVYVQFQRKRRKAKKKVRRVRRQMLQFVKRNIRQLTVLITRVTSWDVLDWAVIEEIKRRLRVALKIYWQQYEMHRKKLTGIPGRVVSFWKPHIRPIVRGKAGKDVEFGPKCSVSYVDGYLFLDKLSFDPYHEGAALPESLEKHRNRFKNEAEVIIADKIYGTRENREMLEAKKVKASLVPLGRKSTV